ncbi:helix-turn-helix domain-containing protein [Kiloniella sp. b19]|uniref:helix-turn-helix domain-containing protein n=1 Tax=Kiloniella sp. GXU_MW_B19 TaxID=3141326 RepID=UPI0031D86641
MTATTLGERILAAREARNLTASQLARRMSVKPSTVANWEKDKSSPAANKITAMAGILGVNLMWLLDGDETDKPRNFNIPETADLQSKLKRLQIMHDRMTQLLFEITSEVNRVQREIDVEACEK